jgi:hypothetical protein
MKYRNRIPEPGTTISGFADSKKNIWLMPTDPTGNTQFFYLLCSQFRQKASG